MRGPIGKPPEAWRSTLLSSKAPKLLGKLTFKTYYIKYILYMPTLFIFEFRYDKYDLVIQA